MLSPESSLLYQFIHSDILRYTFCVSLASVGALLAVHFPVHHVVLECVTFSSPSCEKLYNWGTWGCIELRIRLLFIVGHCNALVMLPCCASLPGCFKYCKSTLFIVNFALRSYLISVHRCSIGNNDADIQASLGLITKCGFYLQLCVYNLLKHDIELTSFKVCEMFFFVTCYVYFR